MKTISSGNYFRKGDPAGADPVPVTLTEDTTVAGGNFVLCRVQDVGRLTVRGVNLGDHGGAWALTVEGGNVRGLYVNGVKLDAFVWRNHEALPLATEILEVMAAAGGEDAQNAWLWSCGWLIDNPAAAYGLWQAAYVTWANGTGNMVYSAAAFVRIRDRFWPGASFAVVRDAVTGHSLETWGGAGTQLIGEYS